MKCNGDQEVWYSEYANENFVGEELIGTLHQIAYDLQFVESNTVRVTIQQDEEPHDFKWSGLSDPEDWTLNDLDENWFDEDEEVDEVQELNVGDVVVLRRIIKPFGLFNHFNPAIVTDKFRDPEDNALILSVDLIYYKGMVNSDGKTVMLGSRTSLTGYEFEEDEKDLHKVELVESLATGRKQISDLFADRVGFSMLCREAINEYLLTEKLLGKLTAEVFNTKEYDGAKAMDITKKMLGG